MLLVPFETLIVLLNFFESWAGLIKPGLKIFGVEVKSTTVDSSPILQLPPFKINFKDPLNSSATSFAETGLTLVDLLALGIANGNFKDFNIFLIILFLGNLTATVLRFAVANFDNCEFLFF